MVTRGASPLAVLTLHKIVVRLVDSRGRTNKKVLRVYRIAQRRLMQPKRSSSTSITKSNSRLLAEAVASPRATRITTPFQHSNAFLTQRSQRKSPSRFGILFMISGKGYTREMTSREKGSIQSRRTNGDPLLQLQPRLHFVPLLASVHLQTNNLAS